MQRNELAVYLEGKVKCRGILKGKVLQQLSGDRNHYWKNEKESCFPY